MIEILKLIGMYIGAIIMLGYCIALLIILFITAVYGMGYLYDSLFGDSLYKLGMCIAKKRPNIRKSKILVKIKRAIEPREEFTRYETPLCTYCFSYTALMLLYMLLDAVGVKYGGLFAFFIYLTTYFVGMHRRYKHNGRYEVVLKNNLEFLKLSFVPLAFLITVVGFIFTVAGFNLQQVDWEYFTPIFSSVQENGLLTGFANELWLVIKCSIAIWILFYVISIPMQLVSYYIILVIFYFKDHGKAYKKLVDFFLRIMRNLRR